MVMRLDTSGKLTTSYSTPTFEIESFATIVNYNETSTDRTSSSPPKMPNASPPGPSDDERKALSQNTSDTTIHRFYSKSIGTIYRFYSKSIGLPWFMAVIITTIVGTFCSHFSRKSPREQTHSCLTDSQTEVWLQFWTSSGGTHLSLYLPVFVVLAFLTNIFTNLNMW